MKFDWTRYRVRNDIDIMGGSRMAEETWMGRMHDAVEDLLNLLMSLDIGSAKDSDITDHMESMDYIEPFTLRMLRQLDLR